MRYEEFLKELNSLQDLKFKDFHSNLIHDDNLIGVKTADLKNVAKKIVKADYDAFIKENKHSFYEENLVHGLLLGYIKKDYIELKKYIDDFIPYIDNWAVCDLTAANLKIYKKKAIREEAFNDIKGYINDKNPWINRFGYVLLLYYYIDDEHIDEIFKLCEKETQEYFVKMAVAWLLSMCFVSYKKDTLAFFKDNKLDKWTYNKALQKLIESKMITDKEKDKLRKMKKK